MIDNHVTLLEVVKKASFAFLRLTDPMSKDRRAPPCPVPDPGAANQRECPERLLGILPL
jgi:hypothetical protein